MASTNINSEIAAKATLRPIEQVAQEKWDSSGMSWNSMENIKPKFRLPCPAAERTARWEIDLGDGHVAHHGRGRQNDDLRRPDGRPGEDWEKK